MSVYVGLYYYLGSLAYFAQEILCGNVGAGCPPKAKEL